MLVRRGMGATCADYGALPAGYLCIDSASGNPTLTPPSSTPPLQLVVTPQGPATCVGGDCAAYNAAGTPFDPTSVGTITMAVAILFVIGIFAGGR